MTSPPAFPTTTYYDDRPNGSVDGMTLRDYFAAKALPAVIDAYIQCNGYVIGTDHIVWNAPIIAYKLADAMLRARVAK